MKTGVVEEVPPNDACAKAEPTGVVAKGELATPDPRAKLKGASSPFVDDLRVWLVGGASVGEVKVGTATPGGAEPVGEGGFPLSRVVSANRSAEAGDIDLGRERGRGTFVKRFWYGRLEYARAADRGKDDGPACSPPLPPDEMRRLLSKASNIDPSLFSAMIRVGGGESVEESSSSSSFPPFLPRPFLGRFGPPTLFSSTCQRFPSPG